MTRALNIKIQDAIYSQLDQHAREHNLTKTQIVEKALSQWFSGNVDEDVDSVDKDVDNVNGTCNIYVTEDVEAKATDRSHSHQTDIEGLIQARVTEYLLGVTCPVPEDSNRPDQSVLPQPTNVDKDVDSSVDNVDGDVDSVDKDVDKNVDDVDSVDKDVDKNVELPPYTQSELAKRLGVGASTLHRWRSRTDFSEWSKARDPQGLPWQYGEDKKYHPSSKSDG